MKLNEDKTEFLYFGSPYFLNKLQKSSLLIGDEEIHPTDSVRNIGAFMDSALHMDNQVNQVCKGAWFHLRNIGKIRSYLTNDTTEKLIHAFVSSKLDNNNGLLYGIPKKKTSRLQRVQNAAAKLVTRRKKFDHVTPILKSLHWLPIAHRIDYKILLLTFKSLIGEAPSYLQDMLKISDQSHTLRSNGQNLLLCPRSKSVRYMDRSFQVAGPTLWNELPEHIQLSKCITQFKSKLKTHLYRLAYQ